MTEVGEPNVLQLQEIPDPQIKSDTEILVRLKAAGINPVDTKLRSRGTFYPDQMPAILGCDGAGIVEKVGSEVKKFQVGDAVYFCNGDLVTILEPDPKLGNLKEARLRNLRISLELMLTPMLQARIHDQLDQTKILQQCARLIDEGKLKILVNQTFPLASASEAHKVLEAGGMKGKLVLTIE